MKTGAVKDVPPQMTSAAIGERLGIGFTTIVYVIDPPEQPLASGVTVYAITAGTEPVFVSCILGKSPVPFNTTPLTAPLVTTPVHV